MVILNHPVGLGLDESKIYAILKDIYSAIF
ncbi:hypothetical protein XENE109146_17635 [Xenorhabdus nematophila]